MAGQYEVLGKAPSAEDTQLELAVEPAQAESRCAGGGRRGALAAARRAARLLRALQRGARRAAAQARPGAHGALRRGLARERLRC